MSSFNRTNPREIRQRLQVLPMIQSSTPLRFRNERSSQVCGQCHSNKMRTENLQKLNEQGHGYRAGDDLSDTHLIWQRDVDRIRDFNQKENLPGPDDYTLPRSFYRDGVTRVTGREYSALTASACHVRGEMSCLSCHQMHPTESDSRSLAKWANDQLKPEANSDQSCLQCHTSDQYGTSHTHHKTGSSGASCMNCHMPHTAYGLLKGVRNHTIRSPHIGDDLAARRPNACNLCHLNQTLQWAADKLQQWYGIERPEFDDQQRNIAASLLWTLKGNAAERALTIWSMGWQPAKEASGSNWQPPFLALRLNDDYPAVRLIARNSLRSYPGFEGLQCDSSASVPQRRSVIADALNLWRQQEPVATNNAPLLIDDSGHLQQDIIDRLIQQQDTSKIDLAE